MAASRSPISTGRACRYSKLTIDWRIIGDKASADGFADALLRAPYFYRPRHGDRRDAGDRGAADRDQRHRGDAAEHRRVRRWSEQHRASRPQVRDEIAAKRITINGLPVISTGEYGQGDWGIYYGELENYYVTASSAARALSRFRPRAFRNSPKRCGASSCSRFRIRRGDLALIIKTGAAAPNGPRRRPRFALRKAQAAAPRMRRPFPFGNF